MSGKIAKKDRYMKTYLGGQRSHQRRWRSVLGIRMPRGSLRSEQADAAKNAEETAHNVKQGVRPSPGNVRKNASDTFTKNALQKWKINTFRNQVDTRGRRNKPNGLQTHPCRSDRFALSNWECSHEMPFCGHVSAPNPNAKSSRRPIIEMKGFRTTINPWIKQIRSKKSRKKSWVQIMRSPFPLVLDSDKRPLALSLYFGRIW